MARVLPRFTDDEEQRERELARAIRAGDEVVPSENGKPMQASADGHRGDRMRGLPMIGRGVSGASPGTDPVQAAIWNEERRRRRPR